MTEVESKEMEGKIFNANGEEVILPPDKICVVYFDYLA